MALKKEVSMNLKDNHSFDWELTQIDDLKTWKKSLIKRITITILLFFVLINILAMLVGSLFLG